MISLNERWGLQYLCVGEDYLYLGKYFMPLTITVLKNPICHNHVIDFYDLI